MQIPNDKSINRIGEKVLQNCGLKAKIIEWYNSHNITIQYEDGYIREHCRYDNFKNGNCCHPKYNPRNVNHIGEEIQQNCGLKAKIIKWINYDDITIKYEDKLIKKHCDYKSFKNGNCCHPKYNPRNINHIGEEIQQNCGLKAKIIKYNNAQDITIEYEDEIIKEHCQYSNFKKGTCCHPKYNLQNKKHIDEEKSQNCGLKAKIIEWNNSHNITIEYEDGYVRKHCNYSAFKKGTCCHPKYNLRNKDHIGEEILQKCGLKAKILEWVDSKDIIIQFEDGLIRDKCRYNHFKDGLLCHLNLNSKNKERNFYDYKVLTIGILTPKGILYKCIDLNTNKTINLTIQEMMNNYKIKNNLSKDYPNINLYEHFKNNQLINKIDKINDNSFNIEMELDLD